MSLHAAYVAGVIDSDGSITMSRYTPQRRKNARGCEHRVYVQLTWVETEKSVAVMEALREQYGGGLSRATGRTERHRQTIHWTLGSRKALALLEDTLPYLRIKREQAALCIEAIKLGIPTTGTSRYKVLPDAVFEARSRICDAVQTLNKPGARALHI